MLCMLKCFEFEQAGDSTYRKTPKAMAKNEANNNEQ